MTEWIIDKSSSPDWSNWCRKQGSLFASSDWHEVLQRGFPCSTLYAQHPSAALRAAITVFRAGPFRIGYLGFPTTPATFAECLRDSNVRHGLLTALRLAGVHVLRAAPSAFASEIETLQATYSVRPETCIEQLPGWRLDDHKKAARDVRKAQRGEYELACAQTRYDAEYFYHIYCATLTRHRGSVRYTSEYFKALLLLAEHRRDVLCRLVKFGDRRAGFLAAVIDRDCAYYLHGGYDPEFRSLGVSDLLVASAISWAQAAGATKFNLLSSPPDQKALVHFKEKWGGRTDHQRYYEIALKALVCSAFRATVALANRLK